MDVQYYYVGELVCYFFSQVITYFKNYCMSSCLPFTGRNEWANTNTPHEQTRILLMSKHEYSSWANTNTPHEQTRTLLKGNSLGRSWWPRGLGVSTAVRLLGFWVLIPKGAWSWSIVLGVVRLRRSLRRADPSSRGVLPSVCGCECMCLCVYVYVSLSVFRFNNNILLNH